MSLPGAQNTLQVLEWPRFLSLAEKEARTEPGRALILSLEDPGNWAADISAAKQKQLETQECAALLDREALWGPLQDLPDPAIVLDLLKRGAVLDVPHCALLRRWIYALDSWTQIPRDEIRGERFRKAVTQLPDPLQPLRILDHLLTPEGELSEKASPKLSQLFAEIRSLKKEIGITLDQLMKAFTQKGVLQENFTDVRDGRYVLPVKISAQGEVEGIIYEASASRQTVFVEPEEVAHLNNQLRQRHNDLEQEIYAVLTDVSKRLQPFGEELEAGFAILAHWDAVQARARLGLHYSGKPIHVIEERNFYLRQTAHPLLWWALKPEEIIRNEIDFGDPVRTLLITGPNTGGKTVLLKTLGIAGICARTGFPFPATDHPTVPFIQSFFADLGDPQSIEQHLSSFSGHILRFKEILEQVNDQSLVLIDEMNSATDPEEGAALSRAFLETLMGGGAIIVATTHDPHLKAMAVSDKRILNASMAFDESSRTPTYRMVLGVPGRSRALETAERLGIPKAVMDLARKYLTREHIEFENVLAKLESDTQETVQARKEAVSLREEAERLKREWTERTEKGVTEMLDRTRQKLRRVLEQAQDEVRSTVKKLDEMKSRREVDQTRAQLNASFTEASERVEKALAEEAPEIVETLSKTQKEKQEKPAEAKLEAGAKVRVPKWKSLGTVMEVIGQKVKVAIGTMQMTLSPADVEVILESQAPQTSMGKKPSGISLGEDVSAPPSQLDLRGIRLDEAMTQLEKYLDQAFRSGALQEVTIVHGLGTGAIREGARKLLKELPYVKTFHDGGAGRGGSGATVVEFDRD